MSAGAKLLRCLLLCLLGCADGRAAIDLRLDDLPADVRSLDVLLSWSGAVPDRQSSQSQRHVTGRIQRFLMKLPPGLGGAVHLRVQGLDTRGCAVAAWEGETTVSPGESRTLPIVLLSQPAGCRVQVTRSGEEPGTITSVPEGIDCGPLTTRCDAEFLPGTTVRLRATGVSARSSFIGWSGACHSTTPCEVTVSSQPLAVSALFSLQRSCALGFCFESPLPHAHNLWDVWAAGEGDAWAVGDYGTILRFTGTFWAPVPSGTLGLLGGVGGSGPEDVWAVGSQGIVLRWQGQGWTVQEEMGSGPDLYKVALVKAGEAGAPAGASDVWVVGAEGTIRVWKAGSGRRGRWTDHAQDPKYIMTAVRAFAADDVWVVQNEPIVGASWNAAVLRFDGSAWSTVGRFSRAVIEGLWGSGPEDVWIAGSEGLLRHFDGDRWIREDRDPDRRLHAVWGSGVPGDVWASADEGRLWHREQGTFVPYDSASRSHLTALGGSGPSRIWAVGAQATIVRFNGASLETYGGGSRPGFVSVWGTSADQVRAVDRSGFVWERSAGSGSWFRANVIGTVLPIVGASFAAWDELWAASDNGRIGHWDGTFWQPEFELAGVGYFETVWASRTGTVWAAGEDGRVVRRTGGVFRLVPSGTTKHLRAIHGVADDDVWIAGDGGTLLHFTGAAPTPVPLPTTANLLAVWAGDANNVWVGGRGILLHKSGAQFVRFPGLDTAEDTIVAVWGQGPQDVWLLDQNAGGYHWNGQVIQGFQLPTLHALAGVWGQGQDLWVVGDHGTILKR